MKTVVSCILIACFGMQQASHAQDSGQVWTLRRCLDTAIARNLDVIQQQAQAEADRINWNTVRFNMLPTLNATASSGINNGRSIDPSSNDYINQRINYSSYGASTGLVLFNAGALRNNNKRARLAYEASKMEVQQQKDNLSINVILAYLQVLSNAELVNQSKNQLALSNQQVSRLEILNRDGAIAPYELSDLQGQLAGDKLSILDAQRNLETAKVNLFRLMNTMYDPGTRFGQLTGQEIADYSNRDPLTTYQRSLQVLALVKAADLRKKSFYWGLKSARGRYFPTLSFSGNANTNYSSGAANNIFVNSTEVPSDDYALVNGTQAQIFRKQDVFRSEMIPYGRQLNNNLFTTISLNLSIPILNGFFVRNQVKLAKVQLRTSEQVVDATKTQLQQAVYEAHINMRTAMDQYQTLLGQVKAYQESFRAVEIRFNEGVINSVQYLIAKNNLDRANINFIAARYDVLLRRRVLDFYEGRPLE